jgi:hypothetical protein
VLVTAGAVVAVSWLADPALRAAFAYAVAWFLLFGGVRPVVALAKTRTRAADRERAPVGNAGGTGNLPLHRAGGGRRRYPRHGQEHRSLRIWHGITPPGLSRA